MNDASDQKQRLSRAAFAGARTVMPGGVSSPVRSFKAVGGTPRFIASGRGAVITDVDGVDYIDYVGSYGPMILGHAHEQVVSAVQAALARGFCFGAPTRLETQLAELIVSALPGAEMVRFVNSGTEATMSALRLARAATGRDLVVKCIGGYHGHVDSLLVDAGSGALTLGTPCSPGVPANMASNTISVHFNDVGGVQQVFEKFGERIACMIVEPIAGNMGLVPPAAGYLQALRSICSRHGALLVFDEVMTGFRVDWGGAQTLYNARPDLTCLGKIIGGGMPVGAYAGPRAIMELVSPSGNVYQAGTLSGNPIAMTAGLETLRQLQARDSYSELERSAARLEHGLRTAAEEAGVPMFINRVGSMICPFFVRQPDDAVQNYAEAVACDTAQYARFFHCMLNEGINLPPSQFETWFISLAHTEAQIDQTIAAAKRAFVELSVNRLGSSAAGDQ